MTKRATLLWGSLVVTAACLVAMPRAGTAAGAIPNISGALSGRIINSSVRLYVADEDPDTGDWTGILTFGKETLDAEGTLDDLSAFTLSAFSEDTGASIELEGKASADGARIQGKATIVTFDEGGGGDPGGGGDEGGFAGDDEDGGEKVVHGSFQLARTNTRADLAVEIASDQQALKVGEAFNYDVTVSNNGPERAKGVVLTVTLPAKAVLESTEADNDGIVTHKGNTLTLPIGDLEEEAGSVTLTVVLQPTAAGNMVNQAKVTGKVTDPLPKNNSASLVTRVDPLLADLGVTASAASSALVKTPLTYTFTASNAGPDAAAAVVETVTLPGNITFGSAVSSQGTVKRSGSQLTLTLGTLASGATATATVIVTPKTAGKISATARVTSSARDNVSANNSAKATTTVTK
jgi:uncharacterized repeat protein (TIGR01451 family)